MSVFQFLQKKINSYRNVLTAGILFIPLVLVIAFVVLQIKISNYTFMQDTYHLSLPPVVWNPASFYPIHKDPTLVDQELLVFPARAGIIIDDSTKIVLFAKNAKVRYPMASTTKLMSALVALDTYKMDDILVIKTSPVEGAAVGFEKGEKVSFTNILYGMLLPSGNDAALAVAQNDPGGEQAFIAKMNNKAKFLHLDDTHYVDSTGLDDTGNYTTITDLARLTSVVMSNDLLSPVVATKNKTIFNSSYSKNYPLSNLNKLLGIDGIDGVKTGFTEEAGGILIVSRLEDGHRQIIIVMGSNDRFADMTDLVHLVSHKIKYLPI